MKRLWRRLKTWWQNRKRMYIYMVVEDNPTYKTADDLTFEITWYEYEEDE